ncbi:anti-sigma factor family protein [Burkholderia sp. LMU1-1-1.1]|uniref:anti-sigma factor family protein n=1 Tax=Burkholderia sp. LMU1-1-1.1 TaxID=3135266 RepID=UPI003442DA88
MSFSDETLMAYADGELAEPAFSEVERAVRSDPAVAARVAQHQALRADVFAAFAPIADEPVPPRLVAAALPGKVADLSAVRAARAGGAHHAASSASHAAEHGERRWSWREWGGVAASLVVGVLVGSLVLGGAAREGAGGAAIVVAGADGALVARGELANALSQQLAGTSGEAVDIGVSFAAKDGALCRSFTVRQSAGLACRSGEQWKLVMMTEAGEGEAGEYRQAGSAMPSAVLEAIDARIAGTTLDAQAEQAAKQRGWKR